MADNNLGSMAELFEGNTSITNEDLTKCDICYESICDSIADFKRHVHDVYEEILSLYGKDKTVMNMMNIHEAYNDLQWELNNIRSEFIEYINKAKIDGRVED